MGTKLLAPPMAIGGWTNCSAGTCAISPRTIVRVASLSQTTGPRTPSRPCSTQPEGRFVRDPETVLGSAPSAVASRGGLLFGWAQQQPPESVRQLHGSRALVVHRLPDGFCASVLDLEVDSSKAGRPLLTPVRSRGGSHRNGRGIPVSLAEEAALTCGGGSRQVVVLAKPLGQLPRVARNSGFGTSVGPNAAARRVLAIGVKGIQ